MAHRSRVTLNVEVERTEGEFRSEIAVAQAIADALPKTLTVEGSTYQVMSVARWVDE